jgi:O-methyltransferase
MTEIDRANSQAMTSTYLDDAVVYRRNPAIKAMKSVLLSSRSILPDAIYRPLFDILFASYKGLLRQIYLRNVALRWLARDHAGLFRAKSIYNVMPYSLVGASGLEATFDAALDLTNRGIEGDFVECGVARGGCAALLATVASGNVPPRKVWLFDSFEGLPSPTSEDYGRNGGSTGQHIRPLERGSCLGTKEQVEWLLFTRFGFEQDSIFLVKGWFQDTLPLQTDRIGRISLLRIDGDWYESTTCCLENLYDQVVPGGYIIVDDYGVCYGCKKAVHEFFDKKNIQPRLIPDTRGGVRFSKDSW